MQADRPDPGFGRLVEPWQVTEEEAIARTPVFTLRSRRATSPRSGRSGRFYYLDAPSWVNVVALTPSREVVMIEQYRHGLGVVALEIPGGMVDAGESFEAAGLRELEEETGYRGDGVELIGRVSPNPAIQNNWCATVRVRNATLAAGVRFDDSEEIATRLVPLGGIDELVRRGVIHHALVVAAFHHLRLAGRSSADG